MRCERLRAARWLVHGPGPQETFASMLERVLERYGTIEPWWGMGQHAVHRTHARSIDDPGAKLTVLLSERMGVSVAQMHRHRLRETEVLCLAAQRRNFCRVCWMQADSLGHARTFRAPLQSLFALTCDRHPDEPLATAPPPSRGMRLRQIPVGSPARLDRIAHRRLAWLGPFAKRMERCVLGLAPWPAAWRGTLAEARLLLMLLAGNLAPYASAPLISMAYYEGAADAFRTRATPCRQPRNPWDAVRMLGDAPTRRMMLWVAAWYHTCPVDPVLWPTWPRGARGFGPVGAQREDPSNYTSVAQLVATLLGSNDPVVENARRRGVSDRPDPLDLSDRAMRTLVGTFWPDYVRSVRTTLWGASPRTDDSSASRCARGST